jgi:tRNA G18 (ribose-2'-O)-methylase SpoU
VVPIQDSADPRLRDYLGLTDVSLRRLREPAEGMFIAESEKVLLRALAADHQPRSALVSARWLADTARVLGPYDVDIYVASDELLASVTGFQVHRGVLAAMHRRPLPAVHDLVVGARLVAVLEDLVDHTNVGAVFRSAAAMGVDAVLVSPRCADPLYRRSVRVSMGTVFQVPWTRAEPWPDALDLLRDLGFSVLSLSPDPTGIDLRELRADRSYAVVLGSEGPGLSDEAMDRCDQRVRIPMRAGVDSLNVAAASAVVFYALS